MLEGVFRVGGHPAPEDQFGVHELRQGVIQPLSRQRRHGTDQLVRELSSERGGDLRDIACRRQAIEPRQERLLERCRDRQRSNRTRRHVPVASFYEQAALNHSLSQLLDEQWHAIGPIGDLVGDLLGQDLAAGDVRDHLGAQPA